MWSNKTVFLFTMVFLLPPSAALWADTLTYPGAAPCNTTLQACIDGATAGDTVEIATSVRIDEQIEIFKSLTLTSAAGFTGLIGKADPRLPRDIVIGDAGPAGGSVDIRLLDLHFDAARVGVTFFQDTGHHFEMRNCTATHMADINNDSVIALTLDTNATAVVEGNKLSSTGQTVQFASDTAVGEAVALDVIGNDITTTESINSAEGIEIRPQGSGTANVRVWNNVVHGVAGCNCGAESALDVEISGAVTANVDLVNNTVDDVPGGTGHGLNVDTPGGTSVLALTLSNNTFSGVTGDVIQMPAPFARFLLDADANNFFDVGPQSPNYPAGLNDLAVDPLFRNPAAADYHLQPGSLLIDAGVSAGLTLPATDFEGRARVIGAAVDIGAHEASSDLAVTADDSPDPFDLSVGGNLTYTIDVANNGPDDNANVVLTGTLPADAAFVSGSFTDGTCSESAGNVTCNLGAVTSGAHAAATIIMTPTEAGDFTSTVNVAGEIPDADPSNNSATVITTINAGAGGTSGTSGGSNDGNGGCSLIRSVD